MNETVVKNKKHGSLPDDMLLTFLMTFTFAAYSYESRITEGIAKLFGILIFAVFILTWIITAIKNGTEKKKGFVIYSAACWIIPQIIILLFYNGPQLFRHSVILYTLSEFSAFFSTRPAELIGTFTGITTEMAFVIILITIAGSFFAGFAYAKEKEAAKQS
ncbi:MAG: hypothetical protein IJY73_01425 [Oscillospiraceae bacterium]|nr:hypothetical protein [Oscillospiraceae bacterium]